MYRGASKACELGWSVTSSDFLWSTHGTDQVLLCEKGLKSKGGGITLLKRGLYDIYFQAVACVRWSQFARQNLQEHLILDEMNSLDWRDWQPSVGSSYAKVLSLRGNCFLASEKGLQCSAFSKLQSITLTPWNLDSYFDLHHIIYSIMASALNPQV